MFRAGPNLCNWSIKYERRNREIRIARAAQVLAIRKGMRLKWKNDSPSLALHGEEELIKRMLLNLLDNAVKYTPAGGEISLELVRQNGTAEIVVRDTGIGIPEAAQPRVFDRFYRVDKARSRAAGAAGLGLSIAQWIVELHDGEIRVASVPGQGSTFRVVLPAIFLVKSLTIYSCVQRMLSLTNKRCLTMILLSAC